MKHSMIFLILLLLVTGARAQGFDAKTMESFATGLFEQMDQDHDGLLTYAEYAHTEGGGFPVDYELLDLNGDGVVDKSEYLLAVRKFHPPAHQKAI
jgi:hypothetical protein